MLILMASCRPRQVCAGLCVDRWQTLVTSATAAHTVAWHACDCGSRWGIGMGGMTVDASAGNSKPCEMGPAVSQRRGGEISGIWVVHAQISQNFGRYRGHTNLNSNFEKCVDRPSSHAHGGSSAAPHRAGIYPVWYIIYRFCALRRRAVRDASRRLGAKFCPRADPPYRSPLTTARGDAPHAHLWCVLSARRRRRAPP